jgi:hypothetical protein
MYADDSLDRTAVVDTPEVEKFLSVGGVPRPPTRALSVRLAGVV